MGGAIVGLRWLSAIVVRAQVSAVSSGLGFCGWPGYIFRPLGPVGYPQLDRAAVSAGIRRISPETFLQQQVFPSDFRSRLCFGSIILRLTTAALCRA